MLINLNTRDGYMLASAIRGPDLGNMGLVGPVDRNLTITADLKWIFTARIRYMCGVEYFAADIRETPTFERPGFCERFNTLIHLHRDKLGGMWHFLSHAESGFDVLVDTVHGEHRGEARLLADLARTMMLRLDSYPDYGVSGENLRTKFLACVDFAENYEGE